MNPLAREIPSAELAALRRDAVHLVYLMLFSDNPRKIGEVAKSLAQDEEMLGVTLGTLASLVPLALSTRRDVPLRAFISTAKRDVEAGKQLINDWRV
jgi:UDP:flavonoid glycosyltransferase YjiC (YdhE family)